MFDFEKFNLRRTVKEGIDTNDMEFKPLKDYCGETVKCNGFFFTDGKYGEQVVIVGETTLINMPKRAVEQFKQISADDNAVKAVLNGELVLTDIKMADTKNGKTTLYKLTNA